MEASPLLTAVATMRAAYDAVAALPVDHPTHPELLAALSEIEAMTRQLPSVSHRIIARLQREASPMELGAKTLKQVLRHRLRISGTDAAHRLADTKDLGPRTSFTGEPMEPLRAKTADAQRAGTIGAEHVEVIRRFTATTDSPNTAGPPTSATAPPNGSPHPNSTPAKPEPTSTTTPNASSPSPTTSPRPRVRQHYSRDR